MHGHGLINWWGFSPPVDLLNYVDDEDVPGATVQALVIGTGDPRHLLMTLARKHRKRLRVYLLEATVEVYARVLLLMGISLQQNLGLRERANLLLDLWGNLYLRPASRDYLENAARRLSIVITDVTQYSAMFGLISAGRLKYRERDAIDAVCRTWYKLSLDQYDPASCWDARLRQILGTRYDYRKAEADWAWNMRLSHRIQQLHVSPPGREADEGVAAGEEGMQKDGHVGVGAGWGQEYLVWRDTGQAFTIATDATSHLPNTSLASVAPVREGTTRHQRLGYWGDLLSGPFPALALASADARVSKTSNGRSKYSGSEVAQWNLESLLRQLWAHNLKEEGHQRLASGKMERQVEGMDGKNASKQVEGKLMQAHEGFDDNHLMESKAKKEEEKMQMHAEDKVENEIKSRTEEKIEIQVEGRMEKLMEEVKVVESVEIQSQSEMNTQKSKSNTTESIPPQRAGSRPEDEKGASEDWLRLDGVEVILVSPSRLNDLTSLAEIEGGLDLLYMSAAMAHLLTPTLLYAQLHPHTKLIVETAQMFPELTDNQVMEYENRVTSSAGEAGWVRTSPGPLCHLLFNRNKTLDK
ncbi:dynein axonemal assembly factor 3 [Panulirus ornatus]|uniref:dynein axonemal assembly factor 3 n=1 Tax=Panulirus ornatus TaxID=150431 RepID=UPI003A8BE3D5